MPNKMFSDVSIDNAKVDVVIVGAGPIGLAHALGLKKLNPSLEVVVLEKYDSYQRKHTLIMEHKQLADLMQACRCEKDPKLSALLNRLKKDPHIRTSELQEIFTQLAKESGVQIVQQTITAETAKDQILGNYPNARLVIGADGTHSMVSESLISPDNQIKYDFDVSAKLTTPTQS